MSDDEAPQRRPELDALPAVVGPVPVVVFDRLLNVVLASQLAERLFISPKTAAVHVSNILAKLGLASRAEVAAWAVRRELAIAG